MREIRENGVEIDDCRNCGGTFFDAGEMEAYINYVLREARSHNRHSVRPRQRESYAYYGGDSGRYRNRSHSDDGFFGSGIFSS